MKGSAIVLCILGILLVSSLTGFVGIAKTTEKAEFESEELGNSDGNINAVIVKGPSHSSQLYYYYTKDIWRQYTLLTENVGLTGSNIDILFNSESYSPYEEFDSSWVDYSSNKNNLKTVLNQFKSGGSKQMGSNDMLYLVWISHGGEGTVFEMHDGQIDKGTFASYIEGISGTLVFIFQPCTSGGWITDVSGPNRIILASCSPNEGEGGWLGKIKVALSGEGDTDPEIGNQDGKVSFEEAFHYAARHVYERQGVHSLLDDNGDSSGHHYTSSGYDPSNSNKDGYIAARTFLNGEATLNADAGGPYTQTPGEELQFNGAVSGGEPPYSYLWEFGDGSKNDYAQNPIHIYENEGDYIATLIVTDSNKDTVSDEATVHIGFPVEDLSCIGELKWNKVEPEHTVEGFFDVQNIGDAGSSLDWEIIEWPDWGTWTFNPAYAYDLKPEDGPKTVAISLVVPALEEGSDFSGEIKVVNKDDDSDFEIIPVDLSIKSKSKIMSVQLLPQLSVFLKNFQNLKFFLR